MPRFLSALLPVALLSAACSGAWAQNNGYAYQQPDPFLDQPAGNNQPYNPNDNPGYSAGYNGAPAPSYAPSGNQPYGRVISATPNYRQVHVPQQVCNDQQVYTGQRNSGVGALAGAVIGGVLGNGVGHGFGRAAATGVGVVAGSAIGNQIEGGYPSYQTVRQCGTQYVSQDQPDGYTVVYEYGGQRHTTRTDTPPGEWLPLSAQPAAAYDNQPYAATGSAYPQPGVVVGSGYATAPAPVMMAPAPVYYPAPVAVQPVIQLGIGGYWGGGRRHWR